MLAVPAGDPNGGPNIGRIAAEQTRVGGKPAGQAEGLNVKTRGFGVLFFLNG